MVDLTQVKMTAEEFSALPESNKHIELINGEVVMAPSPIDRHQKRLNRMTVVLGNRVETGEWRSAPADVYIDEFNVLQPDMFWISPDNQLCHLVDEKYWHGAPDLIIEVLSPRTTRQDRDIKYRLYEKSGVREYWIVEAEELYIEVYVLHESKFERQGVYGLGDEFVSSVLGITLKVDALLKP